MEQTRSSNETKPVIDAIPPESQAEKEENIINPAIVIKKHLTEIYERLNQLEARVEKYAETTNQRVDVIDRTKLSNQEFRQFVDILNRTLLEALLTVPGAEGSTAKTPLKNNIQQGGTPTSQVTEPNKAQDKVATAPFLHPSLRPAPPISKPHRLNFSLKTNGEIFYVGNGVTAIVGDAMIPSGTKVDETLVVKGTLKTGEACRLLKDVKALQNIVIGRESIVEGNLVSGGKIFLGPDCQVKGTIQGEIQEAERSNLSHAI